MSEPAWVTELLQIETAEAQVQFARRHLDELNEHGAQAIKQASDRYLRNDIQKAIRFADVLIDMAEQARKPLCRALGMLAKANALGIGGHEYERAVELYDKAAQIYEEMGQEVEQAQSQIGKIYALTNLGRYDEAIQVGEWAGGVFEDHGEWERFAGVNKNMGIAYSRKSDDISALKQYGIAKKLFVEHTQNTGEIAGAEINQAIALYYLGRFQESIELSQNALEMLSQTTQTFRMARARQSLSFPYLQLGRYNEALQLLEEARNTFLEDEHGARDALLASQFMSDCLIELGQFDRVRQQAEQEYHEFIKREATLEAGHARLNEARALKGLGKYTQASQSLNEARRLFAKEENQILVSMTNIELAVILLLQGDAEASLDIALQTAEIFEANSRPTEAARALLIAARSALSLEKYEQAHTWLQSAKEIGDRQRSAPLTYQANYLLGKLAHALGDLDQAETDYRAAVADLEKLRSHLMVEYRADFVGDKQSIFEDIIDLYLTLDRYDSAFEYVERAKSRALFDLLAFRPDLGIRLRTEDDRKQIEKILELRRDRDRLARRLRSDEYIRNDAVSGDLALRHETEQRIQVLEAQITEEWHRLLIKDADYAREASLWRMPSETPHPQIDSNMALIEYFMIGDRIIAFLLTSDQTTSLDLPSRLQDVNRLIQYFWQNLNQAAHISDDLVADLTVKARRLLQDFYEGLFAPFRDQLRDVKRILIVPHGPLHYLPFHAFYDGQHYLIEDFEISYLPAASLLHYFHEPTSGSSALLALGHSYQERLPFASEEAQEIARVFKGEALVEEMATSSYLRERGDAYRAIHIAAHGVFHDSNPLFASICLGDGWLAALDVFDLRLDASLVTLSACETGRNRIASGDELQGLMRAFLYAGTATLVLSLWSVEDQSAADLMIAFYRYLAGGQGKSQALRRSQIDFLRGTHPHSQPRHRHPYFWAPFFLIGDWGSL